MRRERELPNGETEKEKENERERAYEKGTKNRTFSQTTDGNLI
jgi:hypothetical protein